MIYNGSVHLQRDESKNRTSHQYDKDNNENNEQATDYASDNYGCFVQIVSRSVDQRTSIITTSISDLCDDVIITSYHINKN